jgi:trehalose 6-phosphate synthase
VDHYRALRDEVETTVGRINGDHSSLGSPAVHYLHRSFPRDEMIAMYLAADVMLVTPLRDGMNLVAKEYVACRSDDTGRLVLSEFTGSAEELTGAFATNPHDIEGMKESLLHAIAVSDREAQRRMRAMRRRVRDYDVNRWASSFLGALDMVHPDASYDKAGDMR